MSGGHFDYSNYALDSIADDIEQVIANIDVVDEWGFSRHYEADTINVFKATINSLRLLSITVNRIDYLLSGDDGEDNFHKRLQDELLKFKN